MAYAIVFDLDTNILQKVYHTATHTNAYGDIRKVLETYGFDWMQGSTYFGNESVDAVTCVLAIQEISSKFDWFSTAVRDVRMLRIEENNDLMPAVDRAKSLGGN